MKKCFAFIVAFAVMLSLCSCGKENRRNIKGSKERRFVGPLYNNLDGGRIFCANNVTYYIDYETLKPTPLCSKPNCNHTTSECPSKVLGKCPLVVDDGIYYFDSRESVKELKNGEREAQISSKLRYMSLDSSEVTEIVDFSGLKPIEEIVLYDNMIYFIAIDPKPIKDEYGNILLSYSGGKHYLCGIDLETNEFINYGLIYDTSSLNETDQNNCNTFLSGFYDSKLYIEFSYCDDYEDPIGGYIIFEFDPETKIMSRSDMPRPLSYLPGDYYVGYDDEKEKVVVFSNGERHEYDIPYSDFFDLYNNKLFCLGRYYDLNDGSIHVYPEKYQLYAALDYYDGYYIMGVGLISEKLTEEELLAFEKVETFDLEG